MLCDKSGQFYYTSTSQKAALHRRHYACRSVPTKLGSQTATFHGHVATKGQSVQKVPSALSVMLNARSEPSGALTCFVIEVLLGLVLEESSRAHAMPFLYIGNVFNPIKKVIFQLRIPELDDEPLLFRIEHLFCTTHLEKALRSLRG